ncbi:MAG: hypothetical protein JWO50_664 [Candidatus Kaiserbacteria bacterium]|nr:hypothetical protein [Candidatus Kaiserbacteria bacterium]
MPDINVKLPPGYLDAKNDTQKNNFVRDLKGYVAAALDTGTAEGRLNVDEIDLEFGTLGPYQGGRFRVTIVANNYPERAANLEERRQKIVCPLQIHPFVTPLGSTTGELTRSVWVQLVEGAYGEF